MTPAEMSERLDAVRVETMTWTTDPRDWGRDDVDDAVEVWHRLHRLIGDLAILRRDHARVLARRIDDEHSATTRDGRITVHRQTERTDQWNGSDVIDALAVPMIDANGEVLPAIPADSARAVIPACEQGATSSRWKITELRKVVENADDFRRTVYGETTIALGPLPRALRRSARPLADPDELSTEPPGASTGTGV
jgi:hypothetical protein